MNRLILLLSASALGLLPMLASAQTHTPLVGTWATAGTFQVEESGLQVDVSDLSLRFEADGQGQADFGAALAGDSTGLGALGGYDVRGGFHWELREAANGLRLSTGRWSGQVRPQQSNFLTQMAAQEIEAAIPSADTIHYTVLDMNATTLTLHNDEIDRTFELVRVVP
jgi:hypothetical protein